MSGGAGNDIYVVNAGADVIVENVNEGQDQVQSASSFTLSTNVEHLTLTGSGDNNGKGNARNNEITGNTGDNQLRGFDGNDTLNGGTGLDTLIGGNGNDVLVWDAADAGVQGGADSDILRLDGSGVALDLTLIPDARIADVEIIDVTGSGDNSLTLALTDVLAISSTTNTLRIDGNSGDRLTAADAASWTLGFDQAIGANAYHSYAQGAARLLIDIDIATNLVV